MMHYDVRKFTEDRPYLFFSACALLSVLTISLLFGSIFWAAYPTLSKTGIVQFVFGSTWDYETGTYGIWVLIMGTLQLTLVTIAMAVPLGILTAVYLSEFSHPKLRGILGTSIELLVGIPSVVYGIFGYVILRPYLKDYVNPLVGSTLGVYIPYFRDMGDGEGIFLASVILTVMIIPTIISLSENAMRSVPRSHREGSAALGATNFETIQKVVIPGAMPGILTGITLGLTRALGETMAVVMLTGNAMQVPSSIFDRGEAMTSFILMNVKAYLGWDERMSAIFGIAVVLFVTEALLIMVIRLFNRWGARHA